MIFPVVMYGFESWTVKKVECRRNDALKLWCWRRLESTLDSKELKPVSPKGNQPWIFIGRTDAEVEALIFWPPGEDLTHWKRPWCWERLRAGGEGDNRGWDGWMASPTQRTWVWVDLVMDREAWRAVVHGSQRVGHDWATELNWTELNWICLDSWT